MTPTLRRVVLLAIMLGCLVAGSYWVILEHSKQRLSASELAVGGHVRAPILPQVLRFSCNGRDVPLGNQFKTIRRDDWELAVTVEPACMPEGDFIFSVQAIPKEFLALTQAPSVEFRITPNGHVADAGILHTSGSKELDAKVLSLIERREFKVGRGCGGCRVETTVNVEF